MRTARLTTTISVVLLLTASLITTSAYPQSFCKGSSFHLVIQPLGSSPCTMVRPLWDASLTPQTRMWIDEFGYDLGENGFYFVLPYYFDPGWGKGRMWHRSKGKIKGKERNLASPNKGQGSDGHHPDPQASRALTRCNSKLLPLEVKCKPHLQIQLVARLLPLNTTTAGSHLSAELGHVVLARPETQNPKEIKPYNRTIRPYRTYIKTATAKAGPLWIVLAPPLSSKM